MKWQSGEGNGTMKRKQANKNALRGIIQKDQVLKKNPENLCDNITMERFIKQKNYLAGNLSIELVG